MVINIKLDLKQRVCEAVERIHVAVNMGPVA
jgi:hypothetical protein